MSVDGPRGDDARPPLVLVHGFWHGAWCWTPVVQGLSARGRRAIAVDLLGHGLHARVPTSYESGSAAGLATETSPLAALTLDVVAARLVDQVREVAAADPTGLVTLVAHSFGGVVATRVAETAPELISHLAYVAAVMPAPNVPAIDYLLAPEQAGDQVSPLMCADPATVGAMRLNPRGDDRYRAGLRRAFYADVDDDLADSAIRLLSPDAPTGVALAAIPTTVRRFGSVPRTYVVCTHDDAIRPALQRRFVRDVDSALTPTRTEVRELDSGHSPFLSAPHALVDLLDEVGTPGHRTT